MIRLELNGATVLYTGREGGVSEGPYAELNLGLRTDDDPEAVSANYDLLAVQTGISRRNFALGHQVHGIEVRAHREPPSGCAPPAQRRWRTSGSARSATSASSRTGARGA